MDVCRFLLGQNETQRPSFPTPVRLVPLPPPYVDVFAAYFRYLACKSLHFVCQPSRCPRLRICQTFSRDGSSEHYHHTTGGDEELESENLEMSEGLKAVEASQFLSFKKPTATQRDDINSLRTELSEALQRCVDSRGRLQHREGYSSDPRYRILR